VTEIQPTSPPSTPRKKRFTWRRALVALVILLVLTEVGLRLALGLGNPVIYQPDPACGYLPVPNQHIRRFGRRNDINSFSQRSAEVPMSKPAGTLRLLILGDSVSYGTTYIDQSKIMATLLARDLPGQLHRPVEVLNASTGAWAVSNEWGYLKSRGTFEADVLLFVLNTGDLTQPFSKTNFDVNGGYPGHKPATAIGELWGRYLKPRLLKQSGPIDAGSLAAPTAADDRTVTESVLADLTAAHDFARQHGAQFGIVYSPGAEGEWAQPAYEAALKQLRKWAQGLNVPIIDMQPIYAQSKQLPYLDGIHLNEHGNALVARAIEDHWPELMATAATQPATSPK
jgi:lysophospholipase L1-like esterase